MKNEKYINHIKLLLLLILAQKEIDTKKYAEFYIYIL